MRVREGFSLLELLVAVAVIGVLIAILIPVLSSVAMRGHDAKNQARLRSTHQHFRIYANDHEDFFVNAGPATDPSSPVVVDFGPGNGWWAMEYFMQTWAWPAVAALYYGEAFSTWHSTHHRAVRQMNSGEPGGIVNPQFVGESGFLYSSAMLADPFCFTQGRSPRDLPCIRKVRWSEVAYPSCKGLMADFARPQREPLSPRRNASFVDGSVALVDLSSVAPAPPGAVWTGQPILTTPLGVLGRDVVR